MSRKTLILVLLAAFLISSCGGGAAPSAGLTTATEKDFAAVSAEAATTADAGLYKELAASQPAVNDRVALAVAIESLDQAKLPTAPSQPTRIYQAGDTRQFWIHNSSTFEFNKITAQLMLVSEHAYFWQDVDSKALNAVGQESTEADWQAAGESFDESYNRVRAVFGREESPGLDGDARLYVVHSDSLGKEGGHFSQMDQLPAAVELHSNEGQYFFISNQWSSGIASPYYKEVLAHEYQHMIHKNVDPDEEGWLNEGMSMLAQQIAGMRGDNWVSEYLLRPDQSLWYWSSTPADYGQTYLYVDYLYEQLGEDFIKALAANPANGFISVDQTLAEYKSARDADALYADAIIAAFFNNPKLGEQYSFKYPTLSPIYPKHEFASAPARYQGTVQQYGGMDAIAFAGKGKATLTFSGDQRARLLPTDAHSGNNFWWSNRNDSSWATLTRKADLTNVATATLKYWAWYDIEEDWDYAYFMVSTDNGAHWTLVPATSSRETNPNQQNLGHGFSGLSGGKEQAEWIQETVNLNAYAGKQIMLRFAMQNDLAVNNYGFAVDDLSIPEINWTDDAEAGSKDWQTAGFIRAHNRVPQAWSVRAVEQKPDGSINVRAVEVKNGIGSLDLDYDAFAKLYVFVIGQTRHTTIPANYQIDISK